MEPYRIFLLGHGEEDEGDVVTREGEIIGKWLADENDHYHFIPEGSESPIIYNAYLGLFCGEVADWHERRQ